MPGLTLQTDAFVLLKRPPTDAFQGCIVFSTEHGPLHILQRLPKKSAASQVTLDLFDEATFFLESSNQGQTWFVKELNLLNRQTGIGRRHADRPQPRLRGKPRAGRRTDPSGIRRLHHQRPTGRRLLQGPLLLRP